MEELAKISIRRFPNPVGAIQKYSVNINQEQVGTIKNGEEKVFDVTPGQISLHINSPWNVSDTVEFSVATGETVHLTYSEMTVFNTRAIEICVVLGLALTVAFYNILMMPFALIFIGPLFVFGSYWVLQKFRFLPAFIEHESDLHVCEYE